jgi:hypothetical protein
LLAHVVDKVVFRIDLAAQIGTMFERIAQHQQYCTLYRCEVRVLIDTQQTLERCSDCLAQHRFGCIGGP